MMTCGCGVHLVSIQDSANHALHCYYAQRTVEQRIAQMQKEYCPRTMTGTHRWQNATISSNGLVDVKQCILCFIIDDRPKPKTK